MRLAIHTDVCISAIGACIVRRREIRIDIIDCQELRSSHRAAVDACDHQRAAVPHKADSIIVALTVLLRAPPARMDEVLAAE